MFHVPEKYRVLIGPLATTKSHGNNGMFVIIHKTNRKKQAVLRALVSDGMGWEHVSVSLEGRNYMTPSWNQMAYVKDKFWDEEDTVVQYHPKKSEYVNCHPYVLHMWRKVGEEFELPPSFMVGPK